MYIYIHIYTYISFRKSIKTKMYKNHAPYIETRIRQYCKSQFTLIPVTTHYIATIYYDPNKYSYGPSSLKSGITSYIGFYQKVKPAIILKNGTLAIYFTNLSTPKLKDMCIFLNKRT